MRLLDKVVTFRTGEAATAWLMFAYSFLAMTSYNIVKPITRSKTIDQLGAENLPYILLGAGVLIGFIMQLHSQAGRRLPRRAIIPATLGGLVALLVAFWFLFRTGATWVSVAFYVFGLLFGILTISQFWTLANDVYDARQARRLFGFIYGGGCLGAALGAALTAFTVRHVGTNNLMLASAAVLVACFAIVTTILRRHPSVEPSAAAEERGVGGIEVFRLLRESRHLRVIALLIGFAAVGGNLIEQQLNMAADEQKTTEDAIAAFLATVTVYLSLAGFVVQIGLTSRIHRTLGLAFALLLVPVSLGGTAFLILMTGTLWSAAVARVLNTSLRYTVDKTTREILFLPLSSDLKHRAKPFVDVTMDRFAKAAAALMALVLIKPWGAGLDWRQLSYASLALVAIWVVAALLARREYLTTFRRSLDARTMEPETVRLEVADATTIDTLIAGLSNPDETAVLYAIEMLETLDKRHLITPLLLHHESPRVRARVLAVLELADPDQADAWIPAVHRMLKDPDAGVRAAAVRALAVLRKEEAATVMLGYLNDAEPRVVVTAAAALADSGRPADAAAADAALSRLIADTRAAAAPGRRDAAAALAGVANPAFRSLLVPLIHDPDIEVAREAIRSARAIGPSDLLFVPALVSLLGHRVLKATAREALVSYGESIVPFLAHVLADPHEYPWVRRHVPATLAHIPSQASLDALAGGIGDRDGFLRFKVIEAIETLRRGHAELAAPTKAVEALVVRETARYYEYLTLRYNLVERDAVSRTALLIRALDDKLARGLDRAYRLLGLLYPWKDIEAARDGVERGDARRRASALEYLDNILSGAIRRRVMPILDDAPLADKVRHANSVLKTRARDLDETLAQLVHDDDGVISACAIAYVQSKRPSAALLGDLEHVMTHRSGEPLVVDAASWTLASHGPNGGRRPGSAGPAVIALVDRLRAIPLFAFVSIDELVRIAGAARKVRHVPGSLLYEKGAPADEVHFLLEGAVRVAPDGRAPVEIAAPAALNFEDMLEGRPLGHSIEAVDRGFGLTLGASAFLTLVSDNIAIARGLFRMLLASPGAADWAAVHRPASTDAGGGAPRPGPLAAMEKALILRQTPLFGRATVNQLMDLVAITREDALASGSVLLGGADPPAVYHVLGGAVRLEGNGTPLVIGPGSTVGVAETLTDTPGRRVVVVRDGRALRLERDELFEVLADHSDLLQGVFSGALAARGASGGGRR
jgi:AAA family ATP:ADP antiporter